EGCAEDRSNSSTANFGSSRPGVVIRLWFAKRGSGTPFQDRGPDGVCRSAHLVAPMAKARYFEIGVACLEIIAVLLAILVGVYVSIWAGLLLLVLLLLGLLSLICNYDAWVVRRLSTRDDPLMLQLCKSGFVGRSRRMLRLLPSDPRCRFCMVPF